MSEANEKRASGGIGESIMPPLVLAVICIVVCGLLALAYNKTYVDNTGVLTDDMKAGCIEIFGEGDYEILLKEGTEQREVINFGDEAVNSIIVDRENQSCAIEITEDGYSADGLHILVGINSDGAVEGIYFLSIGETPGLGTKVQNEDFLSQFEGFTAESDLSGIDNVTAATFSSKGMKSAVSRALSLYSQHKEEIFNG